MVAYVLITVCLTSIFMSFAEMETIKTVVKQDNLSCETSALEYAALKIAFITTVLAMAILSIGGVSLGYKLYVDIGSLKVVINIFDYILIATLIFIHGRANNSYSLKILI